MSCRELNRALDELDRRAEASCRRRIPSCTISGWILAVRPAAEVGPEDVDACCCVAECIVVVKVG